MRRIRVHTQQAYSLNPELLARKYEKQIEELKQELAMHNALSERSTIKYDVGSSFTAGEGQLPLTYLCFDLFSRNTLLKSNKS